MTSSRIRFLTRALPIFSLVIAGTSVGFQYYSINRAATELERDKAEIKRLAPKNNEVYDPSAPDKGQEAAGKKGK